MRALLRFLGSLPFALTLIALSALLVIFGTLIESKSGSHDAAAEWIYGHPLFQILLALYFVNILAAALKRFPFKRRQIPFLLTHLGLLMCIAGLFLKAYVGLQGHLRLVEGSGSHTLLIPKEPTLYALDKRGNSEELPFTLVSDAKVLYKSWGEEIKKLEEEHLLQAIHTSTGEKMDAVNLEKLTATIGAKEISIDAMKPLINRWNIELTAEPELFLKESEEGVTLFALGKNGMLKSQHYAYDTPGNLVLYDGGFGGIFHAFDMPTLWPREEEERLSLLEQREQLIKEALESGEPLSPPLELRRGKELPLEYKRALYWSEALITLLDKALQEGASLKELQLHKPWKFFPPFPEDRLLAQDVILRELFAGRGELADPPPFSITEKHLELLEIAFGLDLPAFATHLRAPDRLLAAIEAPLRTVLVKSPSSKPVALYNEIAIPFEQMKIPYEGRLLSFGPKRIPLPYHLRLREATKQTYLGTDRPEHYSASLLIRDRRTGEERRADIAMNRVFETKEGYRFYLSSIREEPGHAREVLLIVNYDPVKWILTYPGAFLVVLGALLLLRPFKRPDLTASAKKITTEISEEE